MFKLIFSFLCIFSLIGSSITLAEDLNKRLKMVKNTGQIYKLPPEMVEELMNIEQNLTPQQLKIREEKIKKIIQAEKNSSLRKIYEAYIESWGKDGPPR